MEGTVPFVRTQSSPKFLYYRILYGARPIGSSSDRPPDVEKHYALRTLLPEGLGPLQPRRAPSPSASPFSPSPSAPMKHYADAKQALKQLLRELMDLNPDAARSLEEGLEETLTVHRLQVPDRLRG